MLTVYHNLSSFLFDFLNKMYLFFFTVSDGHSRVGPQYSSLKSAVVQIVRSEGVKGLYRGVTPNVLGSGGAWGLYFFL